MTPRTPSRIRNALTADGAVVDLTIADGIVVGVGPATGERIRDDELDAVGMLVLSAGAEPHAHLDKALVVEDTGPVYAGLPEGIRAWQRHATSLDEEDFVRRALVLGREYLANGVTAVRTHAEIFPSADPLRSVRGLVRARQALAGVLELQIVVLPKNDIPDGLILAAIEVGADLIGGAPHSAADPDAELDRLLRLARIARVGVDIHADERLDPTSLTALALARSVAAEPLAGSATASHCVSLGLLQQQELAAIAGELRDAAVSVIACPATNLYLQGRDWPVATPRGVAPVRALREAGVVVAGGGDNVRDTINPLGDGDHLATAALLVAVSHLTVEEAYEAVSDCARQVLGLPPAGPVVGAVADLLIIDAPSLVAATAGGTRSRVVLQRGHVVAERSVRDVTVLDR